MKKKWEYKYQSGLREQLCSVKLVKQDNFCYFFLKYRQDFFKSVLIKLDTDTQNGVVLFEEKHVVRSPGEFDGERFYFTTFSGNAHCVDINGKELWKTDIGGDNADFKISSDSDRVYASDHGMYCLEKSSGRVIWTNSESSCKTNCCIAIGEKHLYQGELGGAIRCIDKETGKTVWSYGKDLYITDCTLTEYGLLACVNKGIFLLLNPENGSLISSQQANGFIYRKPVFSGNRLYIGDGNSVINSTSGGMTCYEVGEKLQLRELYRFSTNGEISTNAVPDGDRLYFACEDNTLYALDAASGELIEKRKTKGVCRDIVVEENEIFVLSDKGNIECFSK